MPLLNPDDGDRADRAYDDEIEGQEPLPEGTYRVRLVEVTEREAESREPKLDGRPAWVWAFDVVEPEQHAGRRVWARRILPADNGYRHADFMLARFAEPFRAFGVPLATDTDELTGRVCRGFVTQFLFKSGARAGQLGNSLEDIMSDAPLDSAGGDDGEF